MPTSMPTLPTITPPTPSPTVSPTPQPATPSPTNLPFSEPSAMPSATPTDGSCVGRSEVCDFPTLSSFDFCLGFNSTLNGRLGEFEAAVARWERIMADITDVDASSVTDIDICVCGISDRIDDAQLCVTEQPLEFNIAFGRPVFRTADRTVVIEAMALDPQVSQVLSPPNFNTLVSLQGKQHTLASTKVLHPKFLLTIFLSFFGPHMRMGGRSHSS